MRLCVSSECTRIADGLPEGAERGTAPLPRNRSMKDSRGTFRLELRAGFVELFLASTNEGMAPIEESGMIYIKLYPAKCLIKSLASIK